ncbi:hypothetical protein HA402_005822 [Bradysia odoriphaga]|nr:hypothetical protein HA402_005822 [Bradysia odoriphaga]
MFFVRNDFLFSKMDHKFNENDTLPATSKLVCFTCKDTVTNFYDFYRMVQINHQSLFVEYTKRIQPNIPLTESDPPQRLIFTLRTTTDGGTLLNDYGTLEYSLDNDVSDEHKPDISETHAAQNCEILNENSVNNTGDSRTAEAYDETALISAKIEPDINNDSDSNNVVLFSRKNIDEKLPDHLKVRTTKEKSDAQIKEFVNLSCDICNTNPQFNSFKELQEHFSSVHNQRGYVECCDKKFYRKDRLMNHITNHINPDAFKCTTCGQNSKSKILLRIHMKQHLPTDLRPFQCEKCPQKFVLKSQLTNHEASHFTQAQKKFVCDTCGKAFALKFVMIKHKLTHSKEKINFVCEICAKQFCSKTNLQSHMSHHLQEKSPRVQCSHCSLWYKNVETLRTHMQRHKDDRQHICHFENCSKQCTTSSSLSAHIRYVHLKIKDFECSVCKKKFRRKLELTEHMARHTGQVLYNCQFCPKTFTSSSNYFSHRKYRHPTQLAESKSKTDE